MTKCINETLRLWTPIPNGTYRELENDDYITGLDGQKVQLNKSTYSSLLSTTITIGIVPFVSSLVSSKDFFASFSSIIQYK